MTRLEKAHAQRLLQSRDALAHRRSRYAKVAAGRDETERLRRVDERDDVRKRKEPVGVEPVSAIVEPVSGSLKRKLEKPEQRLARQPRQLGALSASFSGQRLWRICLSLGNIVSSRKPGNYRAETALAGCPGRIRTGLRRFRTGLRAASVLVIGGRRNGCALGANSLDAMFLVGRYLARNRGSYQPGEPRPKRRTTGSQSLRQQRAAVDGIDVAAMFAEGHQLMPSARRGFRRAASAGCFRPKRRPAFLIDSSAVGWRATARRGAKAAEQESPQP